MKGTTLGRSLGSGDPPWKGSRGVNMESLEKRTPEEKDQRKNTYALNLG